MKQKLEAGELKQKSKDNGEVGQDAEDSLIDHEQIKMEMRKDEELLQFDDGENGGRDQSQKPYRKK